MHDHSRVNRYFAGAELAGGGCAHLAVRSACVELLRHLALRHLQATKRSRMIVRDTSLPGHPGQHQEFIFFVSNYGPPRIRSWARLDVWRYIFVAQLGLCHEFPGGRLVNDGIAGVELAYEPAQTKLVSRCNRW